MAPLRVLSKQERAASVHNVEECAEPERCYKCLRYANKRMQDGVQGLLDEIKRLRAKVFEQEGFAERYTRQIAYLARRVKELESAAKAMEDDASVWKA